MSPPGGPAETPLHGTPRGGSLSPREGKTGALHDGSGRHTAHKRVAMRSLMLGALGVVFGDIGTSPLYTLRECLMHVAGDGRVTRGDVLELLSLIFWSLTVVVTVKYLVFIMHADNKGEGGIMALLALVPKGMRAGPLEVLSPVAILAVVGAAFLYGDGAITPAISMLSAVEGISVARPELTRLVIPITIVILVGLFAIQRRGTGLIGALFGPVMIVWFSVIGGLGVWHIAHNPSVLEALSPFHAVRYFSHHGLRGTAVLGSVVLAVTGGEALYADMGHFGLVPIRRVWLFFVMPALVLCYFGQGALVLLTPAAAENPFYAMVPKGPATFALVGLSSMATVIASQALISGSFSLTRQAMQLGLFPRVTIKHTASDQEGQIYIPEINMLLAVSCVLLVIGFNTSSNLASAYGVAVTGAMTITSIVYFVVLRYTLHWRLRRALPLLLLFLLFDIPFFLANVIKVPDGGYVPLAIAAVVTGLMLIWHEGRRIVGQVYTTRYPSFDDAWPILANKILVRPPGTGIFMASSAKGIPPILVHMVEHTRTLHEQVLLLTVITKNSPRVEPRDRLRVAPMAHGFVRVFVHFGFMDEPDVPNALRLAWTHQLINVNVKRDEVTYYLARERILANPGGQMSVLTETAFAFLSRNAANADRYFNIPHNQVIEVGAQIDL